MPSFTSVCIIALLTHVGAAAPSKLADTLDSVRELATHNKSVAHAAPALLRLMESVACDVPFVKWDITRPISRMPRHPGV